ncbi:MAG TPA: ATPase domain-containing protein, partial [Blastocatellia bacterium]
MDASKHYLSFGIPSLDALFGEDSGEGLLIPSISHEPDGGSGSISICISGPDGTGKSLLGLHLAAQSAAGRWRDRAESRPPETSPTVDPRVIYISTDLKFHMARRVWANFALNWPYDRHIPFSSGGVVAPARPKGTGAAHEDGEGNVRLTPCSPLCAQAANYDGVEKVPSLSDILSVPERSDQATVYFVDLTSSTTGDDWGYVNRVLSALEEPEANQPRHVIIVDSVEGFETLVGSRDAYGLIRERRSRIAQVMRSADSKCHMLLIVEEPKEGERLPEEFVTDVVIRLRSTLVKNYVRRSIEIEKARGHSHVRGQHSYMIRSGKGSTTGNRQNSDDPFLRNKNYQPKGSGNRGDHNRASGALEFQSYIHICQSLHLNYRNRMAETGKGRPPQLPGRFAAFGIRYLDQMLEGSNNREKYKRREDYRREDGDDQRGLPCSTTTALIGNPETQKGPLGYAFLSRCFREYADRFAVAIRELKDDSETVKSTLAEATATLKTQAEANRPVSYPLHLGPHPSRNDLRKGSSPKRIPANLIRHCLAYIRIENAMVLKDRQDDNRGRYVEQDDIGWKEAEKEGGSKIHDVIKAAAWRLGPPCYPNDGIPVLLTTQDIHAQRLALEFRRWLLRKTPELKEFEQVYPGCIAAFRILTEQYTVCRRLEIHDLPSALLIHILRCAIDEAHGILHGDKKAEKAGERADQCWGIRVAIDDFSILKDTYSEISEEPLLLRFLVFYLGQEGVTTLLIDTQPGRPDATLSSTLDSELRSLVDNRIYTWRFPFYGEDRVAIAVIPPISSDSPIGVRELRRGIERGTGPETLPLVVDPHFEMYNGIEKGEPEPIPLEIRLFEETPAFKAYIEQENVGFNELFTPLPNANGAPSQVIVPVGAAEHNQLRDLCYLQRSTRLDHTLVFQIDEFWITHPLGLRRAGSYRPEWEYLDDVPTSTGVNGEWQYEWAVDPFRLFQPTEWNKKDLKKDKVYHHRRTDEFHCRQYDLNQTGWRTNDHLYVDRVP